MGADQLFCVSPEKVVLENGVVVLVDSCPAFRSAGAVICLRGGAQDEDSSLLGITHLAEHLLFKRTRSKGAREIGRIIDSLGGELNAWTDLDSLSLYFMGNRRSLQGALELFRELLLECDLQPDDLEKEKEVIRQEINESEDNLGQVAFEALNSVLWPNTHMGRPVYGSKESLDQIGADEVKRRISELVVGARVVVAVAGNVETDAIVEWSRKSFGNLPPGEPMREPPCVPGRGALLIPKTSNHVSLSLGCPWPGLTDRRYLPGTILSAVLGEGPSSRLFHSLREERGLAYDVEARIDAYPAVSSLIVSAGVERANVPAALECIRAEIQALKRSTIPDEDWTAVVTRVVMDLELELESTSERLSRLIDSELIYGRYISTDHLIDRLRRVTVEEVSELLESLFPENATSLVLAGNVDQSISVPEDMGPAEWRVSPNREEDNGAA